MLSERDQNFDIRCGDGQRFVMRVANIGDDEDVIDFQVSALQHLAVVDPSLPVPRLLVNKKGQALSKIRFSDDNIHSVHVLSYLDGTPLDEFDSAPGQKMYRNLGTY